MHQPPEDTAISMVTQLQINRLDGLERLLVGWDGPASVALYLSDEEAFRFADYVNMTKSLRSKKNVSFHVVFKRQVRNIYLLLIYAAVWRDRSNN